MDSNQALAWIIFERDRAKFESNLPGLRIETIRWVPWLTYFISGGVTARYLIPKFLNGLLIGTEKLLAPFDRFFSLHWHICIRKLSGARAR